MNNDKDYKRLMSATNKLNGIIAQYEKASKGRSKDGKIYAHLLTNRQMNNGVINWYLVVTVRYDYMIGLCKISSIQSGLSVKCFIHELGEELAKLDYLKRLEDGKESTNN